MMARKNNAKLTPFVPFVRVFGGIGNDKLWGDDATEADLGGQYHGSDYLDDGADDKWRLAA